MPDISFVTPRPGERTLYFGGTRAGKSSLMDWTLREIMRTRPNCISIIVDSKPRFRGEHRRGILGIGWRDAAPLYKSWTKGPVVPNSVIVDLQESKPFHGLWKNPGQVAIMQSGDPQDWRRMLDLLEGFVKADVKGRERLIFVDEALDFYARNTWGINPKKDVFYRAARAGGERNIGLMLGAHRVHGLPPLITNMSSRVVLFHLRDDSDMKHLRNIGIRDAESPGEMEGAYAFRHYTVEPGGTISEPFTGRVTYPQSYLSQLSAT
jgi:hypothetical protein